MVSVEEVCDMLREEGVPVSFNKSQSSCRVNVSGGVFITSDDGMLVVRNSRRDTLFVLPSADRVDKGVDVFRGEHFVRISTRNGTLRFSYPATGSKKYFRVSYEYDADRDGSPDIGVVRNF